MPPCDPFSIEDNGGVIDHPPLTDSSGHLASPHAIPWLVDESRIRDSAGVRIRHGACVTCGVWSAIPAEIRAPIGPFILPQPGDQPWIKIEVHTLRFGNPAWMAECAPTLDAWCARHDIPLKIRSTWDPAYPDPKFCEIDMLRDFLAGDSDWMFYLDADIVVHPLAPRPSFTEPGFHIRFDRYNYIPRQRASWAKWCEDRFSQCPDESWIYRNAGVWACDRAAAQAMLAVIAKPYHSGIMEQHHWNWWLHQANENGMPIVDLPTEWNRIPEEIKPAWMFHIYSKKKFENLLTFRKSGLLPDHVKRLDSPPPQRDFGKGAVVWPWLSTAAEWDELWFSHRSVIEHWSEKDWPLVLIGDHCPGWWPGEFIFVPRGDDSYATALWLGVQCAENVLWMNDDIFMLADQSPADLRHARYLSDATPRLGKTMVTRGWRGGLGQVLMRNHHHGRTSFDFSTHTPYLYQRDQVRETLEIFGQFWKIPFETAHFNWHRTPRKPCTEKSPGPHKLPGHLWINPRFAQVTPEFRKEMSRRLGPPPR